MATLTHQRMARRASGSAFLSQIVGTVFEVTDITVDPDPPVQGQSATVSATAENVSIGDAAATTDIVATGGITLGSVTFDAAAGETDTVSLSFSVPGVDTLDLQVVNTSAIDGLEESFETTTEDTQDPTGGVGGTGILATEFQGEPRNVPSQIQLDQSFDFTAVLTNNGDFSNDFLIGVWLEQGGTRQSRIFRPISPTIDPGETHRQIINVPGGTWDVAAGSYDLRLAWIENGTQVQLGRASTEVVEPSPDEPTQETLFEVTDIAIQPDPPVRGGDATVTVRAQNITSSSQTATATVTGPGGVTLGTVEFSGGPGEISSDTVTFSVPNLESISIEVGAFPEVDSQTETFLTTAPTDGDQDTTDGVPDTIFGVPRNIALALGGGFFFLLLLLAAFA